MAPASAAPRRRSTASMPSSAQRRRCAETQKSDLIRDTRPLLEPDPGLLGERAQGARAERSGDRQVAIPFEVLDRRLGSRAEDAVALQGPVIQLRQGGLDGGDTVIR